MPRREDDDIFDLLSSEEGSSKNGSRGEDIIIGSVSGVIYRGGKDNDILAVSQGEAWGDLGVDVFRGVTGEGYEVIQDYTIGEDSLNSLWMVSGAMLSLV